MELKWGPGSESWGRYSWHQLQMTQAHHITSSYLSFLISYDTIMSIKIFYLWNGFEIIINAINK